MRRLGPARAEGSGAGLAAGGEEPAAPRRFRGGPAESSERRLSAGQRSEPRGSGAGRAGRGAAAAAGRAGPGRAALGPGSERRGRGRGPAGGEVTSGGGGGVTRFRRAPRGEEGRSCHRGISSAASRPGSGPAYVRAGAVGGVGWRGPSPTGRRRAAPVSAGRSAPAPLRAGERAGGAGGARARCDLAASEERRRAATGWGPALVALRYAEVRRRFLIFNPGPSRALSVFPRRSSVNLFALRRGCV